MPFPVKAQTYADVTTGNPPIQYAYELKATGTGQPPIPKTQLEIPKPPLTLSYREENIMFSYYGNQL